jgi:hypothetical protein
VELLIFAVDHNGYEAGDILAIRPDGFEWGYEEMADQIFDIIHVPDAELGGDPEAAAQTYASDLVDESGVAADGGPDFQTIRRRRHKITPAGLVREKWVNQAGQVLERPAISLTRAPVTLPVKRRTGPRTRPPLPGEDGGPGSSPNPRAQGRGQ